MLTKRALWHNPSLILRFLIGHAHYWQHINRE